VALQNADYERDMLNSMPTSNDYRPNAHKDLATSRVQA